MRERLQRRERNFKRVILLYSCTGKKTKINETKRKSNQGIPLMLLYSFFTLSKVVAEPHNSPTNRSRSRFSFCSLESNRTISGQAFCFFRTFAKERAFFFPPFSRNSFSPVAGVESSTLDLALLNDPLSSFSIEEDKHGEE